MKPRASNETESNDTGAEFSSPRSSHIQSSRSFRAGTGFDIKEIVRVNQKGVQNGGLDFLELFLEAHDERNLCEYD